MQTRHLSLAHDADRRCNTRRFWPDTQVLRYTYMRVQIDRFEDNGWAVLLLSPDGRRAFNVPRELLPEGASAGDVFRVGFEHDRGETDRVAAENSRLLSEPLGDGR